MAGGKETPRQKMIGMMYLVLTALLALNVSKSILDAFVSIEENIQKANIVQVDRGTGFYNDVRSEISATKGEDQKAKKKKLEYVVAQMDKIDKITGEMIKKIDDIKMDIMTKSGEDVKTVKNKDHAVIIWTKYNKDQQTLPVRMNLTAVQAKDQYDVPMHEIIGENIKNPTGSGLKLWNDFNGYRNKLVELTGSYEWGGKKFSIKPKSINTFKDNKDLTAKVRKMVEGSDGNHKEDDQVLQDLYMMLTKQEKSEVHEVEGVHWIGSTFDHAPLVAALASLSSMQQDILSARALALAHWKGKVSTGEYSFNKIMPLAYGPAVANAGDEVELQVMMAAFDSDNQPTVTSSTGAVTYPGNGQGIVKFKAGGATMNLTGTVSIKNKSGVAKTENWNHEITIMKPSGSIELPELNVLYRGYANKVDPTASGYPFTVLTGSGCTVSKSGDLYIAKPGGGKVAYLTVSGKTADGKTVQLKKQEYRVSNLPDPELYWGAAKNGQKGSKYETKLFAKYPPEIPLKASFKIVKWECQVPGALGKLPSGPGGNISAASGLLKAAKPGSVVSFVCTVVGPDGIRRKKAGAFKI
ncbi:MAG: hypothetical protein MK066_07135 [Crocinitomicaceae bacterium]|nr:hypothetical protein [Crocinitomicaceae bacterium]